MLNARIVLVFGVAIGALQSSWGNLVVNGGFEAPGPIGGTYQAVGGPNDTSITGWKTINTGVEWMNPALYSPTWGPAHEGNYCLDLANLSNAGPNGVRQYVPLTTGWTYEVSFWYGTVTDQGRSGPVTICFSIDDYETDVIATNPTNTINWTYHSFLYTAPRSVGHLWLFTSVDGDDGYAFVDDVQINSVVPEPATLTALGVGVAAIVRRRRSKSRSK